MKQILNYILILIVASAPLNLNSQVLTNNGAAITLTSGGTVMHVQGGIENGAGGTFDNSGQIELTGDWVNNGGNNAFVNSSPGKVVMMGQFQLISGSSITHFYDLELDSQGVKTMTIDAQVEGVLDLDSSELATQGNTMFVTNTASAAVLNATGFASSSGNGGLSRETASTSSYLFPVGSSSGINRYRPIEIMPSAAGAHTFKVRMANVDPSIEAYSTTNHDTNLCFVNDLFYHRIYRTSGTSAAGITMWFDSTADGTFDAMAHWQNVPQWQDMGPVTVTYNSSPNLSSMSVASWNDFLLNPFALASAAPSVALTSPSTSICAGDTLTVNATAGFSNYVFSVNSSQTQSGPSDSYQATGLANGDTVEVSVMNSAGCTATDYVVVSVIPPPVSSFGCDTTGTPTIAFSDSSSGSPSSWSWDFADGNTDTTQNPSHTYTANGNYFVKLIVTNACGTDSITKLVRINSVNIEDEFDAGINVYPNPNDGRFAVEVLQMAGEKVEIEILDHLGRQIKGYSNENAFGVWKKEINLSEFSKGAYTLQVKSMGRLFVRKLIVQ